MTVSLGPDLELQSAIVEVLRGSADLKTLLGNPLRIYQDVPASAPYPYVTTGLGQNIPDLAECIDGSEVFPVIHIWSRASGWSEAKKIAATIHSVLSAATITLTENRCLLLERDSLGDQEGEMTDGVTKHIISHYRALCEPR